MFNAQPTGTVISRREEEDNEEDNDVDDDDDDENEEEEGRREKSRRRTRRICCRFRQTEGQAIDGKKTNMAALPHSREIASAIFVSHHPPGVSDWGEACQGRLPPLVLQAVSLSHDKVGGGGGG